jgi:hypothetical protein
MGAYLVGSRSGNARCIALLLLQARCGPGMDRSVKRSISGETHLAMRWPTTVGLLQKSDIPAVNLQDDSMRLSWVVRGAKMSRVVVERACWPSSLFYYRQAYITLQERTYREVLGWVGGFRRESRVLGHACKEIGFPHVRNEVLSG